MNKSILILLNYWILLFTVQNTYAQKRGQDLLDSLFARLPMQNEDTTKVNLLNDISRGNDQIGRYDSAMYYANKALELAENIGYKKGKAAACNNIAIIYFNQGNYSEALQHNFESLKIREEIKDNRGIAASYNNIGNVYQNQGNYSEALNNYSAALAINKETDNKAWLAINYNNIGNIYFNQGNYSESLKNYLASLSLKEEVGDKRGVAASYSSIGSVYRSQGNYAEALKNHFESLKIREEIEDKRGISESYNNLGVVYAGQGSYTEALNSYNASLKIKEEIGDKYGLVLVNVNIGEVYSRLHNYSEALNQYFAALKIAEEVGDKNGLAHTYLCIGDVYTKLGKLDNAKQWLQKSLALSKAINVKEYTKEAYVNLMEIDIASGNYKSALENYKMHILYKDSIFNDENTKKLVQAEMQYTFDKKQLADSLQYAEAQKIASLKFQRQKTFTYSGIGIAILLLSALFIVIRERNKSETLLHNILPKEITHELKERGATTAQKFNEVTVIFTDFVNFTQTAEKLTPEQLVQELHECFTAFDKIIERNGLEKIKTIGDAYMAVCGLPVANPLHAHKTLHAAREIKEFVEERNYSEKVFDIRIGIHTGSVVAGIVGVKKFAYDIWGDTVNTAARMESSSETGKINISETTYNLVKDKFNCVYRGEIEAKNKGKMKMYFVE